MKDYQQLLKPNDQISHPFSYSYWSRVIILGWRQSTSFASDLFTFVIFSWQHLKLWYYSEISITVVLLFAMLQWKIPSLPLMWKWDTCLMVAGIEINWRNSKDAVKFAQNMHTCLWLHSTHPCLEFILLIDTLTVWINADTRLMNIHLLFIFRIDFSALINLDSQAVRIAFVCRFRGSAF